MVFYVAFLRDVACQKLLNLANVSLRYSQNNTGTVFLRHGVYSRYPDWSFRKIAIENDQNYRTERLWPQYLSYCDYTEPAYSFDLREKTRKPCYRKDDRAMRPIYGYPEKFRESSQPPPVTTFPEICKGLFVPIDTKNVHTKLEVRIFIRSWDNRGYSKNLGSPSIRPRSIFSQIFMTLLFGWTCQIWSS